MNFEYKKPEKNETFDPKGVLPLFYDKLYLREKHDSPEESRISMIRRVKELIFNNEINPRIVLNIGSGPQSLEKQMLGNLQEKDSSLENVEFISMDLANILANKLLGKKMENVSHVRANAVNLPFRDNTFGLVISNHAIDFCPQEMAFKEAFRVLNNKGRGIFYLHHPSMLREFPDNEMIKTFWQYLKDNSILFSKEEEIKEFLENIGFSSIKINLNKSKSGADTWWEVVVVKENL